ncbi:hypothetical protein EI77_01823 [Prosthecobacter fusiformis]|uniref:Signal transducing protein n=1 Tax=Prosthecobacter fusiformis TaxID=48464 RepID=A0A4V3FG56_9BACT|nr:hypothetical protein [Prosthecobacter fusiformis]TDU73353.1 hypothetical protein EI77_01823 [Prosthecobacter fusiformis]
MNIINLATMDRLREAEQLAEKLAGRGIKTRVHDESDMQRFLFLTKPLGHFILQVDEAAYSQAVSIIQDLQDENDPICNHIFSCPECSSLAVEYPQFTRKFLITPLLIEWASDLGLFKKKFYCRKCHATWLPAPASATPKISHSQDILVAPPD